MVQLALHAAREAGRSARELGDQADDHVALVDELEVAHVDLAVDVAGDVEDLAHRHLHRRSARAAAEAVRLDVDEVLAKPCGLDAAVEEELLVHVTRIEGDEVLGQLGAEVVDLRHHFRHVHHVAHGEAGIDLLHVRARHQAECRLHGVLLAATAQDVEVLAAAERLRHELRGQDLLLAPDHAVLERGVDLMLLVEAVVHHLDVVHQADEHLGLEHLQLVEVERAEEAVPPPERGVRVDDDVRVLGDGAGGADHVLQHRAAQAGQAAPRQVQDAARAHVRRLAVHHVSDVEELDAPVAPLRLVDHGLQVGLLVNADLSGDDCSHGTWIVRRSAVRRSPNRAFAITLPASAARSHAPRRRVPRPRRRRVRGSSPSG